MTASSPPEVARRGGDASFDEAVLTVVRSLQPGEVLTYGEVAAEAGHPGAARAVGGVMRRRGDEVAWWRVVGAGGRLISPSAERQEQLLRGEGLPVAEGRIQTGDRISPPPP